MKNIRDYLKDCNLKLSDKEELSILRTIMQAQKDAFNEALDLAANEIKTRTLRDGNVEYYIQDKESILKLKIK